MSRLIELPNELLIQIASSLPTTDLRFLSQANRWLHSFVKDYFSSYRYSKGLTRLPEKVLTEIITHLLPKESWGAYQNATSSYQNATSLARTSQRFFPLAMDLMARKAVEGECSVLMDYAAKRGLTIMVRKLLALGADADIRLGRSAFDSLCSPWGFRKYQRPLLKAAQYGHTAVVRLLIDAGAKSADGLWVADYKMPLYRAIAAGREEVALMFARDIEEVDVFNSYGTTVLQKACEKKLLELVRYILSGPGRHTNEKTVRDRTLSLSHVLWYDCQPSVLSEDFVTNRLLESTYQVALILLHHGADPDMEVSLSMYYDEIHKTCREHAAFHPDPRVRNLFLTGRPASASKPAGSKVQVGRTGCSTSTALATADLWDFNDDIPSPWDYSDDDLSSENSTRYDDEDEDARSADIVGSDEEYWTWLEDCAAYQKQLEDLKTLSFEPLLPQAEKARDFWSKKPDSVMLSNKSWIK